MPWTEIAIEAAALAYFMISACAFGSLIEHPASPVRGAIVDPLARRVLMGIAMGATAAAIIYSPWGKRSGAHLNPAFTVTFLRLGRVRPRDAALYSAAHFAGGIAGVSIAGLFLAMALRDPAVHHVTTVPGAAGVAVAFVAEVAITFVLMSVVLVTAASTRLAPYTGLFAALLIATYITVEAPLSGMSMNPARTFGSAFAARDWTALWIYFTAPLAGMMLAAEIRLRLLGPRSIPCAKMRHPDPTEVPCLFCEYAGPPGTESSRRKLP